MSKYLIPFIICIMGVGISLYYRLSGGRSNDTHRYRFSSFARVWEEGNSAKWFVDGEDYFAAVGSTILAAENEILIIDAALDPNMILKRPTTGTSSEWRLERLLLTKANDGVLIYIIMDVNRSENVAALVGHENISLVQPLSSGSSSRWAYNEKVVVVDRVAAFVGSSGFSSKHWDTNQHYLETVNKGYHEQILTNSNSMKNQHRKAADHGDHGGDRQAKFPAPGPKPSGDRAAERIEILRMPWHDVSCGFTGPAVLDL